MIKKTLVTFFICIFTASSTFAQTTLEELKLPKNPAYRIGTGDKIEKEYKVIDTKETNTAKISSYDKEYLKNITYSDSTLKDISKEISKLILIDKTEMLEDVQILWAGAATKSETIKFALYKLSNPEADKPDESIIKKIVRPIASFSSVAGAGFMNPIAATSALMGGTLLNSLTFNDKDLNYKYSKVDDADMIVLIRKVDELQKRMINEYFDYLTAEYLLKMSNESLKKRAEIYSHSKNAGRETLLISDAYYRVALDNKAQLELEFLAQRAALEQLVGSEALREFELKRAEREKKKT